MVDAEFNRRNTLLAFNAGLWESQFVRFNSMGSELERFPCRLSVAETDGEIVASLTNLKSEAINCMHFQDLPDEMDVMKGGHWSLGPLQLQPASHWGAEFCICDRDQRRRVVIKYSPSGFDSCVLIWDQSAPNQPIVSSSPMQFQCLSVSGASSGHRLWQCGEELEILVMEEPGNGKPGVTGLRWRPRPETTLECMRNYDSEGRFNHQ